MTRALVLSGGGAKGSFTQGVEVGILIDETARQVMVLEECDYTIARELVESLFGDYKSNPIPTPKTFKKAFRNRFGAKLDIPDYRFCYGVSVGGIQAANRAQYPLGKAYDAVAAMDRIWFGLRGNKSIYRRWWFGLLAATWRRSTYNSAPLRALIKTHVVEGKAAASGRRLRLGCTNVRTKDYWEATETTPNLARWVMATSAYEPFFEAVCIDGDLWMDGGYRCVTPLKSAIHDGCDTIDVIITGVPDSGEPDTSNGSEAQCPGRFSCKHNTITIGMTCVDTMAAQIFYNDVKRALRQNERVAAGTEKGHHVSIRLFMPERSIGSSLDFSQEKTLSRRQYGLDIAKKVVTV